MDDLISRKAAIEAVKAIKFGLWEIDIPSPTVPEYREHHEQVTELMGVCDCWIKKLTEYESVQPEQAKMIKEIREWINSGNRGSADYFIVDKIEEIINKYEQRLNKQAGGAGCAPCSVRG